MGIPVKPYLLIQEQDQRLGLGNQFSFMLPTNSFMDPVGAGLSYRALLVDGSVLPSWLTFDPLTLAFSGLTPVTAAALAVKVIATDTAGGQAGEAFHLYAGDLRPVLLSQAPDVRINGLANYAFSLPADSFSDPLGGPLTLASAMADGSPLPGWLTFDPTSGAFTMAGAPAGYAGAIRVTATTSLGFQRSESFHLYNRGTPPVLAHQTPDARVVAGSPFDIQAVSTDPLLSTFTDPNGATDTITVTGENGQALPAWMQWDPSTGRLTGTAPSTPGSVGVVVTAREPGGASVSEEFHVITRAPALRLNQQQPDIRISENPGMPFGFNLFGNDHPFTDPAGGTMTLTATLADGSPLPAEWLSFDPSMGVFSGYAPNYGTTASIVVTATSSSGAVAREGFKIINTEPTPARMNPVSVAQIQAGSGIYVGTGSNLFGSGPQGTALSFIGYVGTGAVPYTYLSLLGELDPDNGYIPSGDYPFAYSTTRGTGLLIIRTGNSMPVVSRQAPDVTRLAGTAISFQLPQNAITDPQGGNLAYSARMVDGSALPAWLSFDPSTLTFSGTAPGAETDGILVTATSDESGLSAYEEFNLTIVAPRPVLVTQMGDLRLRGGTGFSAIALPANSFTDPLGGTISYSAALADGSPLPPWISFSPGSHTFNGTTPAAAASLAVRITATTSEGGVASELFHVYSTGVAPLLQIRQQDVRTTFGGQISIQIPSAAFMDPMLSGVGYAAMQQDGSALPSWLTFDAATGMLTGTAPNAAVSQGIKIVATSGLGGTASEGFNIIVQAPKPVLQSPQPDIRTSWAKPISFTLPANSFTDPAGGTITYSASQQDGSPLPSWLTFDPSTGSFSGTAPNFTVTTGIRVTATTSAGGTASEAFKILDGIPPPVLMQQQQDVRLNGGATVNLPIPASAFDDPISGGIYSLTASQQDGSALPPWLAFDGHSFTGAAPLSPVTVGVKVVASGGLTGATASEGFKFIIGDPAQAVTRDPDMYFVMQSNSGLFMSLVNEFFDEVGSDSFTFTARMSDGSPLPPWASMDPGGILGFNPGVAQDWQDFNFTVTGVGNHGSVGTLPVALTVEGEY